MILIKYSILNLGNIIIWSDYLFPIHSLNFGKMLIPMKISLNNISILLILFLLSCERKEGYLKISFVDNAANPKNILLYKSPFNYDSVLPVNNPFLNEIPLSVVEQGNNLGIFYSMNCQLGKCLDKRQQQVFSCFLFHKDTLNKYSWESIRVNKMYLKRYLVRSSDFISDEPLILSYP